MDVSFFLFFPIILDLSCYNYAKKLWNFCGLGLFAFVYACFKINGRDGHAVLDGVDGFANHGLSSNWWLNHMVQSKYVGKSLILIRPFWSYSQLLFMISISS